MSWLHDIFVKASESAWLREHASRYRFVRAGASRFLPGETADAAFAAARRLAAEGIFSLVTHLGENVRDRAEAQAVVQGYLDLLARIRSEGLPAEISVKLTQLGLDLDREFCYANLIKLFDGAAGQTIWIDMEQSGYVDATLDIYGRAKKDQQRVGVCVQSYLRRTAKDIESLVSMGAAVRLVKGAYSEPHDIAYAKKSEVDESYFRLAQSLLGAGARRSGVRAVMGTHDRKLIDRISAWAAQENIPKNGLEFAMLYGIQRAQQLRLARDGYRSDVLISYGTYWFPWFMRRLAERPANVFFVLRNLFSG